MSRITLYNDRSLLESQHLYTIREHPHFRVRVPSAFWIKKQLKNSYSWDGYIRYISAKGYFPTGFITRVMQVLVELGEDIEIYDAREALYIDEIPDKLGKYELRGYQREAIESIVFNELPGGIQLPRGIINAATNAGKTVISAFLHATYDLGTLYLTNSKDLYEQALAEIPEILPGQVGHLDAKEVQWNKFMVVMIPTLHNRLNGIDSFRFKDKLNEYNVCLVDECDLANSKTYKDVLSKLAHCYVKVGLSGSVFRDRDKTKNENIRGLFGEELFKITNKQLMDEGYSAKVKVTIIKGNKHIIKDDYETEYSKGIVRNKYRNRIVCKRAQFQFDRGRAPLLIIVKLHEHVEILFEMLKKQFPVLSSKGQIDWVHHDRKDRREVIQAFRKGKIKILVGSYILKRGQNFPLMRCLINASGGKADSIPLQILGRATRKHKTQKYKFMDDFWDEGNYLKKHSRARVRVYKNEKLPVKKYYTGR